MTPANTLPWAPCTLTPNTSSPTEPPPRLALAPECSRSQLDPASSSPASSPLRHPRVPPSTASSQRPGWAPSPPHPVSCRVPSIRPLIHTRQMFRALCGVVWQNSMDRVPALMELTVSGGHFEPRADSVLSVAHGGHPGLGTVQGPSCWTLPIPPHCRLGPLCSCLAKTTDSSVAFPEVQAPHNPSHGTAKASTKGILRRLHPTQKPAVALTTDSWG